MSSLNSAVTHSTPRVAPLQVHQCLPLAMLQKSMNESKIKIIMHCDGYNDQFLPLLPPPLFSPRPLKKEVYIRQSPLEALLSQSLLNGNFILMVLGSGVGGGGGSGGRDGVIG